jgi:hypothetical protein
MHAPSCMILRFYAAAFAVPPWTAYMPQSHLAPSRRIDADTLPLSRPPHERREAPDPKLKNRIESPRGCITTVTQLGSYASCLEHSARVGFLSIPHFSNSAFSILCGTKIRVGRWILRSPAILYYPGMMTVTRRETWTKRLAEER